MDQLISRFIKHVLLTLTLQLSISIINAFYVSNR